MSYLINMNGNNNASQSKLQKTLLLLFLVIAGLYLGKDFLVPLAISALISFLFYPLAERLEKWGAGRVLSTVICIFTILTLLSGMMFLFYTQLMSFSNYLPQLKEKAGEKFHILLDFIESRTRISSEKQVEWFTKIYNDTVSSGSKWVQSIFFTSTSFLLNLLLVMAYNFCFLYYREKLGAFFLSLSGNTHKEQTGKMMGKIQHLASHYFSGIIIVMAILGTMHSIGLLLLGIDHAIFLGYLAGTFILVPVVGTIVGSTIPFLIALLTKDSVWYAAGVAAIFSFNLFIESQILTPMIVGGHIRINPMAIILAIVLGGLVWGLAGMVLFIPMVGVLKIIADNSEEMLPLRILLSEEGSRGKTHFFKWFGKK
jgi:AI-2 transport protein TqsA